jgi:single-strand DNA-binding protein
MKTSKNFVCLIGNVGKDPTIAKAGETDVCTFSLATSEGYKDKQGQWQNRTTWHYIKMFGKDAQYMCNSIRKGDMVTVIGKIENRTVGEGDNRKTYSSVVCETFVVQEKRENMGNQGMAPETEDLPY